MKELDELSNEEAVTKLTAAFEESGLTFDRAAALAALRADHHIYTDDEGNLVLNYEGSTQKLSGVLSQWGRTGAGSDYVDGRSLRQDEKNPGGVRAKSDLVDAKAKSAYISKHGLTAYEKLALTYTPAEEVRFKDEYSKLTVAQKSALAAKGTTITAFPTRPTDQIRGSFIAHDLLAKQRAINPNKR
ncbi:MAG TPA: hypothetical protein VK578_18960 [Edaphobacter sp.]|nr:hypothetical protein [Edaphobacter sp.]